MGAFRLPEVNTEYDNAQYSVRGVSRPPPPCSLAAAGCCHPASSLGRFHPSPLHNTRCNGAAVAADGTVIAKQRGWGEGAIKPERKRKGKKYVRPDQQRCHCTAVLSQRPSIDKCIGTNLVL